MVMTREDALALIEIFAREPAVPPLDTYALAQLLVVVLSQPNVRDLDALRRCRQNPILD
jgi:hypothetical protein